MANGFTQQTLPASKSREAGLHQHVGQRYLPTVWRRAHVTTGWWALTETLGFSSPDMVGELFLVLLEKFMRKLWIGSVQRSKTLYFHCPNISQYTGRASGSPRRSLAFWARCTWTLPWGGHSAPSGSHSPKGDKTETGLLAAPWQKSWKGSHKHHCFLSSKAHRRRDEL